MKKPIIRRAIGIMLFVVLVTGCATKIHNFPDTAPKNIKLIISHNLIAKESLHPALSLFSMAASSAIAAPGLAQLAMDLAGQTLINSYGDETAVTMLDKLDQEVFRQTSCALLERGYNVSLEGFNTWEDLNDWVTVETGEEFYAHLEENYGYEMTELELTDHEAVLLVEYYMVLNDESVGDYLTELRVEYASLRSIAASRDRGAELIFSEIQNLPRSYERKQLFSVFRNIIDFESWPLIEKVVIPECSNKRRLESLVLQELPMGSTEEEIHQFLTKHNIEYSERKSLGFIKGKIHPLDGLDTIDDPVNFVFYFNNKSRTLRNVEIYYDHEK